MKWKYALEFGGDKSLEISIGTFIWQRETKVRLNGNLIGAYPDLKDLEEEQVLQLPDETTLRLQFVKTFLGRGFRALRNDQPLPGSYPDPTTTRFTEAFAIIYSFAVLNIVLGFIALIFQMQGIKYISGEQADGVEVLQMPGFSNISFAIGFIFLVLGFFTQRRSLLAPIIAMMIFGLESVLLVLFAFNFFNILYSVSGVSRILFGKMLQREALLIGCLSGCLAGWIIYSIGFLVSIGQGILAINKLRKETLSNASVINKRSSRRPAVGGLVAFILVGAGIYTICTSQVNWPEFSTLITVIDGPSIDERNAAASAAVAYESGADFVEALGRAGVPCTNPTISPLMASGFHVADSFSCNYATGDLVNLFVAWPSELSSTYFSMYFEAEQEAGAATGAQNLTLKGELWYAVATTDQRLFDIQEALGGQLVQTASLPSEDETVVVQTIPAPNEGETVVGQPAPTPGEGEISQFATGATASSQYSEPSWSAMQVVGAPDTAGCGDLSSAWASLYSSGKDWLLPTYDQPVIPTRIMIYQTYNPGAVSLVEVLDEVGNSIIVYEADPTILSQCPYMLEIEVRDVNTLVRSVRLTIDQSINNDWTEIDAVQLFGKSK